jgi:hypothetical protein
VTTVQLEKRLRLIDPDDDESDDDEDDAIATVDRRDGATEAEVCV